MLKRLSELLKGRFNGFNLQTDSIFLHLDRKHKKYVKIKEFETFDSWLKINDWLCRG